MKKFNFKKLLRFWIEGVFLTLFLVACLVNLSVVQQSKPSLGYTDLLKAADDGKIQYISITRGSTVMGVHFKNGQDYTTVNLGTDTFLNTLASKIDDIRTQNVTRDTAFDKILYNSILLLFCYALIRGTVNIFGSVSKTLDRSGANSLENTSTVKFDDVAGLTEEKQELMYAVNVLKSGEQLKAMGMRPLKGILLDGPPGVGKTLLAKAIAGEAGVNFLSYSGGGFDEMFVGVGAMRVRQMFKRANEMKPCIIFIDEIDNVGAKRTEGFGGASREYSKTLTSILERMDGIESSEGIMFIGATNRPEALDEALLRPGRFDKIIHIGPPRNKQDREAIVSVHMKGKTFAEGVTAERIAKLCYGLTGAEIEASLNDAIMESFKAECNGVIDLPHVDSAVMKLRVKGVAKGKHTGADLERVAVHEIGHAMMDQHVGRKVVKVSVQPYSSGVGGVTIVDGDSVGISNIRSRDQLINDIRVLYAGMIAEKVVLGEISNGNSNDLERATQLLHHMVASWGMVEGSILSTSYLSNVAPMVNINDSILSKMEELGASIRKEVEDYFMQEPVKARLIELARKLAEEEVLYELSEETLVAV